MLYPHNAKFFAKKKNLHSVVKRREGFGANPEGEKDSRRRRRGNAPCLEGCAWGKVEACPRGSSVGSRHPEGDLDARRPCFVLA
jgi:hypothetical protein